MCEQSHSKSVVYFWRVEEQTAFCLKSHFPMKKPYVIVLLEHDSVVPVGLIFLVLTNHKYWCPWNVHVQGRNTAIKVVRALISSPGRQRQADPVSFKTSLVYTLNSRTARATSRDALVVLITACAPLRKARLHFCVYETWYLKKWRFKKKKNLFVASATSWCLGDLPK